ncbi:hypothetical protein AX766_09460 [Flavobacterium covae]|uniref:hypothetical protein n=1 Tax=Flavobacterium covae TaxID=2906076 RepID=UPI0007C1C702|nr:hypothetical protein [Flavobacterium covae]AND64629.1 hypothetical protein AX766_09460 [Flavobacterium covae]
MITSLFIGCFAVLQIVWFGFFLKKYTSGISNKKQLFFLILLLVEHFFFGYVAYKFTLQNPISDVKNYLKYALNPVTSEQFYFVGHDFFILMYRLLFRIGFNFQLLFLSSVLVSSIPFVLLFKRYLELGSGKIHCLQYTLLLPSFHFWSVLPGKDCLVFVMLVFILYKLKEVQFSWSILVALFFLFLVRPYVGVIVLLSLVFVLFEKYKNIIDKKFWIPIVLLSFFGVVFFMSQFVKLESLSIESILLKFEGYQNYVEKHTASNYLADLGYIGRVLMLLCLPLFYKVNNDLQYVTSIENALILIFIMYFFFKKIYNRTSNWLELDVKFALYTSILIFLFLSTYIYNLGLASRMRLMFYPLFFYVMAQSLKNDKLN